MLSRTAGSVSVVLAVAPILSSWRHIHDPATVPKAFFSGEWA